MERIIRRRVAGMIEKLSFEPSASGPVVTLPAPTGGSAVGTDAVALADPARGGRRLMVTRCYPAMAFSDLPAIAPTALSPGGPRSVRAIAVQRAYLRAFLDRYMLNRRSRLLTGTSPRWPQVTFQYRRRPRVRER